MAMLHLKFCGKIPVAWDIRSMLDIQFIQIYNKDIQISRDTRNHYQDTHTQLQDRS